MSTPERRTQAERNHDAIVGAVQNPSDAATPSTTTHCEPQGIAQADPPPSAPGACKPSPRPSTRPVSATTASCRSGTVDSLSACSEQADSAGTPREQDVHA